MTTPITEFLRQQTDAHPLVFIPLLILVVAFVVFFLCWGGWHWVRLWNIRRRLERISRETPPEQLLRQIEEVFSKGVFFKEKRLPHLWKEYQDSLHRQQTHRSGRIDVVAVRATVPAEMYFSTQSVVDGPLHTEFFKHLPGIFTGLGIIGTFSGLIGGLRQFKVSEDAETVRSSLESLMNLVGDAFVVSAFAIGTAMAVTFLEKLLLAALYRQTDQIAHEIDARFDSGAGEEYLSRLVDASESSASQSKILKDALVRDLGDLMREMASSQIQAAQQQNQTLASTIVQGIQNSLQGPLQQLADTVQTASGDQSANVSRVLQDVMSSFSQKLSDLFGGQISGLNQLNQQTASQMQQAVEALRALVGGIADSSRSATDAMTERVAQAIESMEVRQGEMNSALHGALASVAQSMQGDIARMSGASNDMVQSVSSLSGSIQQSIDQMRESVDRLATTANAFSGAGERVAGVMSQAAGVSSKMAETSGALVSSATAMQEVLRDYQSQRESLGQIASEFRGIVELARRDARMAEDAVRRIEASADKLSVAQTEADAYLGDVSRVLADIHKKFAEEVERTLDKANTGFHGRLSTAVHLLSGAIEELESKLTESLDALGRRG